MNRCSVRLIAVDKIRAPYIAAGCAEFRKRIAPYFSYDEIEVRPSHGGDPARAMREEAERMLKHVRPDDRVWLLERTGTTYSSEAFAREIETCSTRGTIAPDLCHSRNLRRRRGAARARRSRWSLSPLTLLHEWARMVVLEQLYRSAKIARNEPYHH